MESTIYKKAPLTHAETFSVAVLSRMYTYMHSFRQTHLHSTHFFLEPSFLDVDLM